MVDQEWVHTSKEDIKMVGWLFFFAITLFYLVPFVFCIVYIILGIKLNVQGNKENNRSKTRSGITSIILSLIAIIAIYVLWRLTIHWLLDWEL